jgi:hypothetical protein
LVCFYSSHMNCLKQWNLFSNLTPHRRLHSNYFSNKLNVLILLWRLKWANRRHNWRCGFVWYDL